MAKRTHNSSRAIAVPPRARIAMTARGQMSHTDSGSGAALLALHGGMGGSDQSWLLGETLLGDAPGWRVIGAARPGYPGTSLALGASPQEQADLYPALLDALGIERAIVAAVSAGGPSALHFALRYPDRCRGVILVSAATGTLDTDHVLDRLRKMRGLLRVPFMGRLMGRMAGRDPEAGARRSIDDPALLERTLADATAGPLIRGLGAMNTRDLAARMPGTWNDTLRFRDLPDIDASALRVPLLVLHGTADRIVPFTHAERAATAPGARLVPLEGGGHVALFTHLDEVRAAVAAFVQTLDQPPVTRLVSQ